MCPRSTPWRFSRDKRLVSREFDDLGSCGSTSTKPFRGIYFSRLTHCLLYQLSLSLGPRLQSKSFLKVWECCGGKSTTISNANRPAKSYDKVSSTNRSNPAFNPGLREASEQGSHYADSVLYDADQILICCEKYGKDCLHCWWVTCTHRVWVPH